MVRNPKLLGPVVMGVLALSACGQGDDKAAPTVSITSPAAQSPVNGTTPVQVTAADNTKVTKVNVYARTPGSTSTGVLVGSATTAPYVISWYTPGVPNQADVELYATATDDSGNTGTGDPVKVRTNNPGLPLLTYLAGFNLPSDPNVSPQSLDHAVLVRDLDPTAVRPPAGVRVQSKLKPQALLVGPNRYLAVEWAWPTYNGADGYGIYLGKELVGPYARQRNQAAASAGTQKYSQALTAEQAGGKLFGVVTAITQNRTVEGGFSNAQQAAFIRDQESANPGDGQTVTGGRPTLTWVKNPDAIGYLYFVYDGHPLNDASQIVWTNVPRSTDALSAPYPSDLPALKAGTYYWWVAAVGFDANNQANAFSYSPVKKFVVP